MRAHTGTPLSSDSGSDAKKVVDQIKPKEYIFPMHFGTKVFEDVLPIDEFLDGQTARNIVRLSDSEPDAAKRKAQAIGINGTKEAVDIDLAALLAPTVAAQFKDDPAIVAEALHRLSAQREAMLEARVSIVKSKAPRD